MLSNETIQVVYPGAVGTEDSPFDVDHDSYKTFRHGCGWAVTKSYLRFIRIEVDATVGEDALSSTANSYRTDEENLKRTTFFSPVEGNREQPNLGDEAHIVYGIDPERCRSARLLIRSKNATLDVLYGGCDSSEETANLAITPISETALLNGVLTVARDALRNLDRA